MNSTSGPIRATIPLTSMAVELELPARTVVLEPVRLEPLPNVEEAISRALANPMGTAPFSELVRRKLADRPDASAVIVVSDNTRPVPYRGQSGILWPLVDGLLAGGFRPEKVCILVASGTHRRMSDAEIWGMLDNRVERTGIAIRRHDAFDQGGLVPLGVTDAGTEITIDRGYLESDFRILTGLVESHFMAGASGGRKSICPGLLGIDSIRQFHGPEILADPQSTDLATNGNPCHELSLEVARMASADFILNVTAQEDGTVVGVFAGEMESAHEAAVKHLRSFAGIPVSEHFDLVVTHAGKVGVNHYQAAKAASAAARVVKPGGRVILVADTVDPDPVGGDYYRALLTLLKGIGSAAFDGLLRSAAWKFVPDQWEVQMWARFFDRVPSSNFFYFSPQTALFEYGRLPCRAPESCLRGLDALPPKRQVAEFVSRAIEVSLGELAAERADADTETGAAGAAAAPTVAFLAAGPYGIPVEEADGSPA
jgi:lactate racemase